MWLEEGLSEERGMWLEEGLSEGRGMWLEEGLSEGRKNAKEKRKRIEKDID